MGYFCVEEGGGGGGGGGGSKRKVSARDAIFGGCCVVKSLPLKDGPVNRVLQVVQRIKSAQTGLTIVDQSMKPAKIGVHSSYIVLKLEKIG